MRQEPKASRLSVAHSLGMLVPIRAAARITEVPAGTVTSTPSISSVTMTSDSLAGVPKSGRLISVMFIMNSFARKVGLANGLGCLLGRCFVAEVLREVVQRRQHGVGRHAAHRTQGPVQHQVTQVAQQVNLLRPVFVGNDL